MKWPQARLGTFPVPPWQFAKDVTAPIHSPVETAKATGRAGRWRLIKAWREGHEEDWL